MSRKFSIIGCEHAHIGIFIEEMISLGWQCAGIYEPNNRKLASRLSEQFQIPLVEDREALLADNVEIVGCAAINNEKIDIVELCEQRGKHVMIDKPAATSRAGLARLKAVLDRGKIQVGMLLTERYRSSIIAMKELIHSGKLGKVVHIAMRKPHRLTPANRPQWHFSKEQNGGIIIDLAVHDVDLLRWLTGSEIASTSGYMVKNILPEYPDFFDLFALNVIMEDGTTAQLHADWHNPEKSWTWGDCRIFVTGTNGTAELRLEGDPLIQNEELLLSVGHDHELTRVELTAPDSSISEDFIRRIEGQAGLILHEDIYKATLATIEADEKAEKLIRR